MLDEKDRKWLWENLTTFSRKRGLNPDDYPSTMRRLEAQYQAILLTIQMLARCLADLKLGNYQVLDHTVLPDVPGTKPPRWRRWPNYTAVVVVIFLITMAFGATVNMFATQHSKDEEQIEAAQAESGRLRSAIEENTKQVALLAFNQNDIIDRIEKIGEQQGTATLERLTGKGIYRYITSLTPETITLELPDKQGKPITYPHGLTKQEYDQLNPSFLEGC